MKSDKSNQIGNRKTKMKTKEICIESHSKQNMYSLFITHKHIGKEKKMKLTMDGQWMELFPLQNDQNRMKENQIIPDFKIGHIHLQGFQSILIIAFKKEANNTRFTNKLHNIISSIETS